MIGCLREGGELVGYKIKKSMLVKLVVSLPEHQKGGVLKETCARMHSITLYQAKLC